MSRFRTTELSNPQYERDCLRFVTIQSPALGGRGDFSIFLPPGWEGMSDLPLVTLLHGVYGSHWAWSFKAGAHLTALAMIEKKEIAPMAIVMPSDGLWRDGSGYLPHIDKNYDLWITEDVRDAVFENFKSITRESRSFISGLSMGGYGALRLGAKYTELYSGISAHSSITDFPQLAKFIDYELENYKIAAQEERSALGWLLQNRGTLPPIRFDCGRDDLLIEENRELHRELTAANIPHDYDEFEGEHNWDYWTVHLRDTLKFFNAQL